MSGRGENSSEMRRRRGREARKGVGEGISWWEGGWRMLGLGSRTFPGENDSKEMNTLKADWRIPTTSSER